RQGECGRNSERHADTKTSECAGIHVGAGAQAGPCETQEVTAVGDGDVVWRRNGSDCVEDGPRMDFSVSADQRAVLAGHRRSNALAMATAKVVGPRPVDATFAVTGRGNHRLKREMRRGKQFRSTATIIDQLAGAVGNPDEARVGENRRRAITDLVVKLSTHEQYDVGIRHRGG